MNTLQRREVPRAASVRSALKQMVVQSPVARFRLNQRRKISMKPKTLQTGQDRMSAKDHLVWRLEKADMGGSPVIVVLFVLDGDVDQQEILLWHERAAAILPRMSCRLVTTRAPFRRPLWAPDPHFDPAHHIRRIGTAGKGTHQDLLTLTEALAETPFIAGRPPWESYVIEGLEGGKTAYMLKISHAIADGLRLRELFLASTTGSSPMLPRSTPAPSAPAQKTAPRKLNTAYPRSLLRRTATALEFTVHAARDMADPPKGPQGAGDGVSRRFLTLDLPLAQLKAAARAGDGTVQDALIAGLIEGCRLYNEHHQVHRPLLRILSPYGRAPHTQHDPSPVGNHWFIVRFRAPAGPTDVPSSIRNIRTALRKAYSPESVDWMGAIAKTAPLLPNGLLASVFRRITASHDFAVSNIPGPPAALAIAGVRATHVYGIAPSEGAPMMATMVSCAGTCHVTLNIDPAVVRDVDLLGGYVRQALEQVAASTAPLQTGT